MGRIVQTGDTAAKQRRSYIRSCAEVLGLLATRPRFGPEEQDMAAFMVFSLRGIYQTIDKSAEAWDDRNYWKKAEGLRDKWSWSRRVADELEEAILANKWYEVTDQLIALIPHFQDVSVKTRKRDADWWGGALAALRREKANSL